MPKGRLKEVCVSGSLDDRYPRGFLPNTALVIKENSASIDICRTFGILNSKTVWKMTRDATNILLISK